MAKPSCKDVKPENAARLFKNPASILSNPRVKGLLAGLNASQVLELGAGCLRNAQYLQQHGFRVSVVDVPGVRPRFVERYEAFEKHGGVVLKAVRINGTFAFVVATFVIETICDPRVRTKLLLDAHSVLKADGFLLLSVRGPRDLLTAKNKGVSCSDGYFTPNKTFSRAYTPPQVERLLKKCGFQRIEFLHKKSTAAPELLHLIAWANSRECDE